MLVGEILDDLLTSRSTGPCITATRHFPARASVPAAFPTTLDPRLQGALRARGIEHLYSHQARCWELVETGHSLVVVTPTASGKTLCYNLPVLQALLDRADARVLYLFPTKALAQDQLAKLIVDMSTGEVPNDSPKGPESPAIRARRKGGLKGGKARAAKLSQPRRAAIARKAARARWGSRQD